MAIDALLERPRVDTPKPNVGDDIGANVEALRLSGLVDDSNSEDAARQVTTDFKRLGSLGIEGELFVAVSHRQLPLSHRISVLNGLTKAKHGEDHPDTYIYAPLWVPSTQEVSYDDEGNRFGSYDDELLGLLGPEYDGKKWKAHGRLIIPNADSPDDPILHHLDKPFDDKYAEEGEETQLEAVAKQKAAFEAEHPDANMNPFTARDVSFLALVRLIKGESMPLKWGYMRDATLSRTTVDGVSIVGRVRSYDDRLRLYRSAGRADSSVGVGVSVGHNPLEPQVS